MISRVSSVCYDGVAFVRFCIQFGVLLSYCQEIVENTQKYSTALKHTKIHERLPFAVAETIKRYGIFVSYSEVQ